MRITAEIEQALKQISATLPQGIRADQILFREGEPANQFYLIETGRIALEAHEPAARKAGLQQEIIDTVKFRRPLTKLAEKDAVVVQLGRDAIGKHKVGSNTFARAQRLFGNQGLVNIVALMGDYAATTILLNVADRHVRPKDQSLLPLP